MLLELSDLVLTMHSFVLPKTKRNTSLLFTIAVRKTGKEEIKDKKERDR